MKKKILCLLLAGMVANMTEEEAVSEREPESASPEESEKNERERYSHTK